MAKVNVENIITTWEAEIHLKSKTNLLEQATLITSLRVTSVADGGTRKPSFL